MFESFDEVVIDSLFFFSASLMFETLALDVGIVELAVSGRNFLTVDDKFVDLDGFATGSDFGERNEFARNTSDEAGVEGVFFDFFFKDLLNDFVVFHFGRDLHS